MAYKFCLKNSFITNFVSRIASNQSSVPLVFPFKSQANYLSTFILTTKVSKQLQKNTLKQINRFYVINTTADSARHEEATNDSEESDRKPYSNYGNDRFDRNKRFSDSTFQKRDNSNFRNRFKTANIEADYENAEPIESDGVAKSYINPNINNGFAEFNLPAELMQRLSDLGYNKPYEIQAATLKHTLDGKDLVGKAFTGSGKTLAFAIPIITRILKSETKSRYPKCLVLAPTRELCLQLTKTIEELAPSLKSISVYGGTAYESQIRALSGTVDIVCATPGRLRDLMNRKNFIPDDIEIICLDEADELLTPNFVEQIKDVIELSNKKQILMFSATINKDIHSLINTYMKNPVMIDLTKGQKHKLPTNITHYIVQANRFSNVSLICKYLKEFNSEKCIIFTNTKREAISINFDLRKNGVRSSDLHSDISQARRQIILEKFRNQSLDVIVATDVAARGIDIPEINLIIQIGPPNNGLDYYIHRSGRTGRAGRVGNSIIINNDRFNDKIDDISRLIKFKKLEAPTNDDGASYANREEQDDDDFSNSFDRKRSFNDKFSNRNKSFDRYSNRDRVGRNFNDDNEGDEYEDRPRSNFNKRYSNNRFSNNNRGSLNFDQRE